VELRAEHLEITEGALVSVRSGPRVDPADGQTPWLCDADAGQCVACGPYGCTGSSCNQCDPQGQGGCCDPQTGELLADGEVCLAPHDDGTITGPACYTEGPSALCGSQQLGQTVQYRTCDGVSDQCTATTREVIEPLPSAQLCTQGVCRVRDVDCTAQALCVPCHFGCDDGPGGDPTQCDPGPTDPATDPDQTQVPASAPGNFAKGAEFLYTGRDPAQHVFDPSVFESHPP
jgi:hypothetical protein